MTKDTTKEAAIAADRLLFDDWFDAIEDGVRTRVRGFIETMLEEEGDYANPIPTTSATGPSGMGRQRCSRPWKSPTG